MNLAGGGGQFGEDQRRRRQREFNEAVGRLQQGSGVACDLDAVRAESGEFA